MTRTNTPSSDPRSGPVRGYPGNRSWVVGLALIALGGVLLAQQILGVRLVNGWAMFLLIPAFGAFQSAARRYQERGTAFSGSVTGSFITGLSLLAVTVIFLFGLDWSTIWPIFIILAGIGGLLGAIFR